MAKAKSKLGPKIKYAGFWIRVVARLIDGGIGFFIGFVFGFIIGFVIGMVTVMFKLHLLDDGNKQIFRLIVMGLTMPLIFAYYILFESSKYMGTPGKIAVGIAITDANGKRITKSKATARIFSKILSALVLFGGFIMVAFHPKKRGLHDLIADTYVVYKDTLKK